MSAALSDRRLDTPPLEPFDLRRLVERVRLYCRREAMFAPGREAVVMVSGGQDSLALLHLLATGILREEGPRAVRALHVNHHLRGEESVADERLVRRHCEALGVSLEVVDSPIEKGGGNVQARARDVRRLAALQVLGGAGNTGIALGHTLDDQVETMLYRLGRYGGMAALAPMSPVDRPWVRPLLIVRRGETAHYCVANELEFAIDRGNEYPGYVRTGIRERLLPAWEAVLPGAVVAAGRAAEVAAEAMEIVGRAVEAATKDAMLGVGEGRGGPETMEYSVGRVARLDPPLRRAVIRSVLEDVVGAGIERSLVLEIEGLLQGTGSDVRPIGDAWLAVREYGTLRFRHDATAAGPGGRMGGSAEARRLVAGGASQDGPVTLSCPGEVRVGDLVVRAEPTERFRAHDPRVEAYLDADAVEAGLWVRAPRPGDRMRPLGSPGDRALQDILVDLKIPRSLRTRVPVVGCGERILWLGGLVVAEEGRIATGTTRLLHLSVGPADDHDRGDATGHRAKET